MAQATTTTVGTVLLAGDFLGTDATFPELRPTGVTPGVHANVRRIYIDSKGRTTNVGSMTDLEYNTFINDVIYDFVMTGATTGTKGVVQAGTNIDVAPGGVISVATATTGTKGLMQVGTGLSVNAGVVSVTTPVVDATTGTKGVVQVGSGLSVTAGVLSVALATTGTKGVMQVGNGLSVNAGVVSVTNLDATVDATAITKGVVQVGTNIDVTAGVISVATATTGVKGLMQVGSGLSVNAGTVSLAAPDTTAVVKGVVQVGTNVDVTAGVISVATASGTATLGMAKGSANITCTAGALDIEATYLANCASINNQNTYTKAQVSQVFNYAYTGTFTPDFSNSNIITMTLTGNVILSDPAPTVQPGGVYTIIFIQDATGSRTLTLAGTAYKTNQAITLSTTPGARDILTFICYDTNTFYTQFSAGYL